MNSAKTCPEKVGAGYFPTRRTRSPLTTAIGSRLCRASLVPCRHRHSNLADLFFLRATLGIGLDIARVLRVSSATHAHPPLDADVRLPARRRDPVHAPEFRPGSLAEGFFDPAEYLETAPDRVHSAVHRAIDRGRRDLAPRLPRRPKRKIRSKAQKQRSRVSSFASSITVAAIVLRTVLSYFSVSPATIAGKPHRADDHVT